MSGENILEQIADDLRNQNPPADPAPANPAGTESGNNNPAPAEPEPTKTESEGNQNPDDSEKKEWWESNDNPTDKPADQKPEDKQNQNEPEIPLDEDIKLLMEYKKSGKTLADFIKEYQVEDISSWSDEKLVEQGLKDFMTLTEEEYEQALYDYKQSSVFQKKQLVENFKEKFQKKNESKLKELTSSNVEAETKAKAIVDKYRSDLEEFSNNIANKELYGLKITDEMSKNLKNYLETKFSMTREDGTIDVEKMYSVALWLNHGAELVKANVTKARNEGKEQVIKEVTNPSKNMNNSGRAVSSGLEAVQEAFSALFPS